MSVLAIIAALVIEQWRPLGERKGVQAALAAWRSWLEKSFNGGQRRHGLIAWTAHSTPRVAYGVERDLLTIIGIRVHHDRNWRS